MIVKTLSILFLLCILYIYIYICLSIGQQYSEICFPHDIYIYIHNLYHPHDIGNIKFEILASTSGLSSYGKVYFQLDFGDKKNRILIYHSQVFVESLITYCCLLDHVINNKYCCLFDHVVSNHILLLMISNHIFLFIRSRDQ